MTKDTKEIDFDDVPAFALVRERIHAIHPNVEFLKAGRDIDTDIYTLRLQLAKSSQTDLCLPENLLSDLSGKNSAHRDAELDRLIRTAIDRLRL
jgi:hypothetical protein